MDPRVTVVKIGTLCLEPPELAGLATYRCKHELGIGGGSTVTLVRSDRTILVDTGFEYEGVEKEENKRYNADALLSALRLQNVEPEDIDIVFLTHEHRDHTGNLGLFPQACIMAMFRAPLATIGRHFVSVADKEEIAKNVHVISTPGHTKNHASLVVDGIVGGLKARIAVAGDAIISCSYWSSRKIWDYNADFYDRTEAEESIVRLMEVSDIIIPGHGTPFMSGTHSR